ncbi:23S rRNA (guanosine-2'-O-) -methyltransferase [Mycoplasmopsis meleagridis]|uniref:TrmH family tRNA/rRNA methyltransferase YacO n=1 Tax=Mycoplasmopsis meleagridis ATCC 25294 TaxID=1264554 RepID=A0A0F5H065_9BACT|nr:23S rRNA (guanosine(2251)-2'-O)-methyltransferase RlmB [Mycoplasmopsis meleagridis]KKB26679.1 TrmH family tRNA/rRNA methyltransferase YacO [Mycoplasmopsis meleagridis ATCC 25294]OAD18206.1 23S rRNA (guanosine-2'-O-) -methyltransferase [Mycoplasmopsis meleagridis]VEU77734.1 rRNA methylase [Mycoplasmopsis meleagridis]
MEKLLLCGRNSVFDALKNNFPIEKIFIAKESNNLSLKIKKYNVAIEIVTKKDIEKITTENHQGIIAVLKDFPIYDLNYLLNEKPNKVLILDHIQDPHNLGAIIRTANAFGIKFIIISKERSADITNSVLKISSGGFIGIKIVKVNSISATIHKLNKNGYWIYASALEEKSISLNKIKFNSPSALIVGNENYGVSKSALKMADQIIHIEQFGSVQSLNVSVATGILLYEFVK